MSSAEQPLLGMARCFLITGMGPVAKPSWPISQPLTEEEVESPFGLVGRFQPASQVFSLTLLLRITTAAASAIRKAGGPRRTGTIQPSLWNRHVAPWPALKSPCEAARQSPHFLTLGLQMPPVFKLITSQWILSIFPHLGQGPKFWL